METKRCIWALGHALVVLVLCYLYGNSPYVLGADTKLTQWYERWKCLRDTPKEEVPDSLLLVNVAYDRQLVKVYDEDGFPKGEIDITDRSKLLAFLKAAREADNYRYILLDVMFTDEYTTEYDEELYRTISSMRHIVIPRTKTASIADSLLLSKARYSDYSTTLDVNNFVRYSMREDGEYTLPFSVHHELTGEELRSYGWVYYTKGHLCRRCITPQFGVMLWNETSTEGVSNYYNLGADLLDLDVNISDYIRDRFVVIGDLKEDDMHDTYLGPMAGSLINYDTIATLRRQGYVINWTSILFLWMLYTVVVIFLYKDITLWESEALAKIFKGRLTKLLLSFAGLAFLFGLLNLLCYSLFGMEMDVWVPSAYFSIFSSIISIRKQWKEEK